jgi:hypothetical protein
MKTSPRWTLAFLLAVAPTVALACTCRPLDVPTAKDQADVVFAGKVESIVAVDKPGEWEPRLVVRFKVARVWKGPVSESFEMHTNYESSSCGGFFPGVLKEGKTLLVYGTGRPAAMWKGTTAGATTASSFTVKPMERPPLRADLLAALPDSRRVYTTSICTRTQAVEYAVEDFKLLGKAKVLGPLEAKPDPELVEATRYISNGMGQCGEFDNARLWKPIKLAAAQATARLRQLEISEYYRAVPRPNPYSYRDLWFESKQGGVLGLCRKHVVEDFACGDASVKFLPVKGRASTWTLQNERVGNYDCPSVKRRRE